MPQNQSSQGNLRLRRQLVLPSHLPVCVVTTKESSLLTPAPGVRGYRPSCGFLHLAPDPLRERPRDLIKHSSLKQSSGRS